MAKLKIRTMAKAPKIEMDVKISSAEAIKKIQKAIDSIEELERQLGKLNNITIGVSVVEVKKKWWQFWR